MTNISLCNTNRRRENVVFIRIQSKLSNISETWEQISYVLVRKVWCQDTRGFERMKLITLYLYIDR